MPAAVFGPVLARALRRLAARLRSLVTALRPPCPTALRHRCGAVECLVRLIIVRANFHRERLAQGARQDGTMERDLAERGGAAAFRLHDHAVDADRNRRCAPRASAPRRHCRRALPRPAAPAPAVRHAACPPPIGPPGRGRPLARGAASTPPRARRGPPPSAAPPGAAAAAAPPRARSTMSRTHISSSTSAPAPPRRRDAREQRLIGRRILAADERRRAEHGVARTWPAGLPGRRLRGRRRR